MKKSAFVLLYGLAFAVVTVNLIWGIQRSLFFDIADLPQGELRQTVPSPDGRGEIRLYSVKNALGSAVRGELVSRGKTTNVFWQTDVETVTAVWVTPDTVKINAVPLQVFAGAFYDCRRGTSLFQPGALDGNAAPDYPPQATNHAE